MRKPNKDKMTFSQWGDVSNYLEKNIAKKETSSYKIAKKFNLSLSSAIYTQNNLWVIPESKLPIFSIYYLLSWEASYLAEQLTEGTISRQGIIYQVIYHRTNPAEIKKLTKIGGHVKLSFRSLLSDFGVQPVVLVSLSKPLEKVYYTPTNYLE